MCVRVVLHCASLPCGRLAKHPAQADATLPEKMGACARARAASCALARLAGHWNASPPPVVELGLRLPWPLAAPVAAKLRRSSAARRRTRTPRHGTRMSWGHAELDAEHYKDWERAGADGASVRYRCPRATRRPSARAARFATRRIERELLRDRAHGDGRDAHTGAPTRDSGRDGASTSSMPLTKD